MNRVVPGRTPKGKVLFCDPEFHKKMKIEAFNKGMKVTDYTRVLARDPRPFSQIFGKEEEIKKKEKNFRYGF